MAFWSLGIIAAPILGPTLGGWITDTWTWRWVFFINLPVGILSLLLISQYVVDPHYLRRRSLGVDAWGIGMLAVGMGALQIMLDKGQEKDWFGSNLICILSVIALVCLAAFVFRELRAKDPIVHFGLLRSRTFASGVTLATMMGFILYGSLVLLPLFMQTLLGWTATTAGIWNSPRGIGTALCMPLVAFMLGRGWAARRLLIVGFAVSGICFFGYSRMTLPVCTVSGDMVTLLKTGVCSITASQTGDIYHAGAIPMVQSFHVTSGTTPQTITFGALPNQPYGAAPFTVSATASSGLTVSFASTTVTTCTVTGDTVTLLAPGRCAIKASQPGSATYAAATPVAQAFTITKLAQTISFATLPNEPINTPPFTVAATASSGLPVSFASTTLTTCTVSGNTVTLIVGGRCAIKATQAGNSIYAAATPVVQAFTITKLAQTISFAPLPNVPLSTLPFTVTATASSGLAVSFASTTPTICTVSGNTVTLVAAGRCAIKATQTGNATYAAATPVVQGFQVTP